MPLFTATHRRGTALGLALALTSFSALPQGTGLPSFLEPAPAQQSGGGNRLLSQIGGCAVGGAAGAALGNMLGKKAAAANPNAANAGKKTKGAAILGGVTGCAVGAAVAGGIYDRLSEQGKRNRERELAEAAQSAQVRTYKDPQNPTFTGTVTPGPVVADAGGKRECRDIEDKLADADQGEPVVIKYCRDVPNGRWAAATA